MAVLVVLLVGRQGHFLWVDHIHSPIGGIVPVAVPWFGALGAVTISIYGVVNHYSDWQDKWNLWHFIRPVVGAILGTVAFLIFIGVIQATERFSSSDFASLKTWIALASCPARQGQQRSLRRMRHDLSWALARSPGARSRACARLASFWEAGLFRPR